MPDGQLTGSAYEVLEEYDVDGAEYEELEDDVYEELDPLCIQVPSPCAIVPDGQLAGSEYEVLEEEYDVAGAEYDVLEEYEELELLCIHVPSPCAIVPDGQFAASTCAV